jgi:hypothetical protein
MEYMHVGDTNFLTVRQWLESKGCAVVQGDGGTIKVTEPSEGEEPGATTTVAQGKVVCLHEGRISVRDTPPKPEELLVSDDS